MCRSFSLRYTSANLYLQDMQQLKKKMDPEEFYKIIISSGYLPYADPNDTGVRFGQT